MGIIFGVEEDIVLVRVALLGLMIMLEVVFCGETVNFVVCVDLAVEVDNLKLVDVDLSVGEAEIVVLMVEFVVLEVEYVDFKVELALSRIELPLDLDVAVVV